MANNIRTALSPLLMISYVCGLRIAEFPADHPGPWLNLLYNLLLWSIYSFFIISTVMIRISNKFVEYKMCSWTKICITLVTALLGMYHDKRFKECLTKLTIVDETMERLGITTDHYKLRTRVIWIVLGWCMVIMLLIYGDSLWWQRKYGSIIALYISIMLNYSFYITTLDDLIFMSILEYVGLKFDQINERLRELADGEYPDNRRRTTERLGKNSVPLSQRRDFPNVVAPSCEGFTTWIVIQLHLELRKISREINSVFGMQLTLKMTGYFVFMAELLRELFNKLFLPHRKHGLRIRIHTILITSWLILYVIKLLLINYMCERVSAKANATRDFINRVSYTICNMEIRENIMQLILQITQAPLKFCGLGLFQFGFKFLHRYSESILTFLIILIQANKGKYIFLNDYD